MSAKVKRFLLLSHHSASFSRILSWLSKKSDWIAGEVRVGDADGEDDDDVDEQEKSQAAGRLVQALVVDAASGEQGKMQVEGRSGHTSGRRV